MPLVSLDSRKKVNGKVFVMDRQHIDFEVEKWPIWPRSSLECRCCPSGIFSPRIFGLEKRLLPSYLEWKHNLFIFATPYWHVLGGLQMSFYIWQRRAPYCFKRETLQHPFRARVSRLNFFPLKSGKKNSNGNDQLQSFAWSHGTVWSKESVVCVSLESYFSLMQICVHSPSSFALQKFMMRLEGLAGWHS